jgi:hypothetical protein
MLLICWPKKDFFFLGKLIIKCLQHTGQEICLEKECVFNTVNVSGATVTLQVESD